MSITHIFQSTKAQKHLFGKNKYKIVWSIFVMDDMNNRNQVNFFASMPINMNQTK